MEAEIILDYNDGKVAKAIADAVSPDNYKTPKSLKIETTCRNGKVITRIQCEAGLPTFIATIDDLLFCTSTAENALKAAKRL